MTGFHLHSYCNRVTNCRFLPWLCLVCLLFFIQPAFSSVTQSLIRINSLTPQTFQSSLSASQKETPLNPYESLNLEADPQSDQSNVYWVLFSSLLLLGIVFFFILYYNNSPLTKALRREKLTRERTVREVRFYILTTGIMFLITEIIFIGFYSSDFFYAVFNLSLGLVSVGLFLFLYQSKFLLKHMERIILLLFSLLTLSMINNIIRFPGEFVSFCFYSLLLLLSYSTVKSIQHFWFYCGINLATLLICNFFHLITDAYTVVYCYTLLLVSLLNYGRHLVIANTGKKLLFTSKIVNDGSSLIVGSNGNEELVFISENVTDILGYKKEELHSNNWFKKTLAPEDKEEDILQKIRDAKHNGKIYSRKLITANGGFKWVQWQYKKFGEDMWIGIGQDITEQMQIQEQYQNLIQSAADIIHKTDNGGNFTFFNRHVENLLGYKAEELIGKSYTSLVRKDYVKKMALFYNRSKDQVSTYDTIEFPAIKKNGEEVWLSQNVSVERDANSNIISFNAIVRDITALKLIEHEKQNKQRKVENNSLLLRELTLIPSSKELSLTQILKHIIEKAGNGLGADRVSIWFCVDGHIQGELFYEKGTHKHWTDPVRLKKTDHPVYFDILKKGGLVVATDVENNEATKDFFKDYFEKHNAKSLLDVPIFLEGKLEGVLCCESIQSPRNWDSEDLNFGRSIAGLITLAIESNKRKVAEEQLAERSRILSAIGKTTEQLLVSTNIFKTLGDSLHVLGEALLASRVYFYENIEEQKTLSLQNVWYNTAEMIQCIPNWHQPEAFDQMNKFFDPKSGSLFVSVITQQLQEGPVKQLLTSQNVASVLILPIHIKNKLYGFIGIDDMEKERVWTNDNITLIQSLTNNIANALERVKNEHRIQENENNFRQINETINDVFWLYDNIKKKYLYISPSCEEVLGMSQDKFYAGESYGSKFVIEEDLMHYRNAESLLVSHSGYEIEYRIRTKSGMIKWINEKSSAIRNEKGELVRNSGICTDITEKKQFLNQIRQLSLVAEKTNNGVLILDRNGFAIWANDSYLNTLEVPLDKLINKRPSDLFLYKHDNPNNQIDAVNGTNYTIAYEIQTFKKTKKWLEINNTIIEDEDGNTVQQIQILTDITQKRVKDLELAQHRAMLRKYSSNLEYQNELKEKLIHASSIEEITKVALKFVKENIKHCIHISLLTLDEKKQYLTGYFILKDTIEKERHHIKDFKSFETVKTGKMFVEADLQNTGQKSSSDAILIKYGAVSYVVLPLLDIKEIIGLITISFDSPFTFNESETEGLNNFAVNLSTTIQKLNLKNSLQEKNNDIRDSLNYAKNIQKTMLPNLRDGIDSLINVTLFFKPKDIVSGDFYWAKETETHLYISLGDCTGHGVPGAFLTIIGTRILEQIVRNEGPYEPTEILTELDKQLFHSLNTNQNEIIRDGMEISLCVVDKKEGILHFCGVGMGLVYFIGNEEIYIKGQRGSIGDYKFNETAFEKTSIKISGNEHFYMASDGYQDQLGGSNYKRYSKRRLIEVLKDIQFLEPLIQESTLKENLKEHMRENFQTDDISVLGFQIKLK